MMIGLLKSDSTLRPIVLNTGQFVYLYVSSVCVCLSNWDESSLNSQVGFISECRLEVDSKQPCHAQRLHKPTRDHLLRNLRFLYDALLNPATMQQYMPETRKESGLNSATTIHNCKQFVKHYDDVALSPSKVRVWCDIQLVDQQEEDVVPPPELLVLPVKSPLVSLRREAAKAFQETYLFLQRFQAEHILGFEKVSPSTPVELLLGLTGTIKVRGRCLGVDRKLGHFKLERGTETWVVDCICGTKDDDGERMLACDSCSVWQHTICNGIGDYEEVPETFVCMKCLMFERSKRGSSGGAHGGGNRYNDNTSCKLICKDKIEPPFTRTYATFSEMGCQDKIASHEKSCTDEIAAIAFVCKEKTPMIVQEDFTFYERNCEDEIAANKLIFKDTITPSCMEADTTFPGMSCKDGVSAMLNEARHWMCTITVM